MKPETMMIDDVKYIREDALNEKAQDIEGMECVIIRTYSAGVFLGYLKSREGKEVILVSARRLWQWYGASSISQLAVDGTSRPDDCKFPCEVPEITLTEAIEIVPCSEKARKSLQGVEIWKS